MGRKPRKALVEHWKTTNLIVGFIEMFVKPFYRLPKAIVSLKRTQPVSHIIFDCVALGIILSVMYLFSFWRGMEYIGAFFGLFIFIGVARRIRHKKQLPVVEPEENPRSHRPSVNDKPGYFKGLDVPDKVEPKKRKTPTTNEIPDFDVNDLQAWRDWLQNSDNRKKVHSNSENIKN